MGSIPTTITIDIDVLDWYIAGMPTRHNLSPTMHIALMGTQFMDFRGNSSRVKSTTWDALQKRGLIDENYSRTDLGMAFIQERCNLRDERIREREPDLPFIYNDAELLGIYARYADREEHAKPSIYNYRGTTPFVHLHPEGHIALISCRMMWDIQVGMRAVNGIRKVAAGAYLRYEYISGHKGSYGYKFVEDMEPYLENTSAIDELM